MNKKKIIPAFALVALLVCFRFAAVYIEDFPPNFQPIASLFFCGAACVGLRSIWIPLLAWFVSYPLTSAIQGYGWHWSIFVTILSFSAVVFLAQKFRNKPPFFLFAGSLLGAIAFYLITNFSCWLTDPRYAKTVAGFIQAMWTGIPTDPYPPTWVFFKNSLLSNGLFTGLFLIASSKALEPEEESEEVPEAEEAEA